jgi:ABC-2 type transport system ATP-binding protein
MALVELDNVSVSYGNLTALNGVSFTMEGGAVGLLGPNGAGKSTLLRTLLGFNRPKGGEVRVFGHAMPKGAIQVRQRLGYMPEREVRPSGVSAVGFLAYCGELNGMPRVDALERAHEVLDYVGMSENRYRKMETYSLGTVQRVKFAQALLHDPELLLLDEPTNNLDPEGRVDMLRLIRELSAKRNVTVLLSTHLLPDVEAYCDRVIMLARGKVLRDSPVDSLTTKVDGAYETETRGDPETFVNTLRTLGLLRGATAQGRLRLEITDTLGAEADAHRVYSIARECGITLSVFEPVRRHLEDVFMEAVTES